MFAQRLEQLRKEAGLTQGALGKRLGEKYGADYDLSQAVISAYEKGKREPQYYMIYVKLADFFGVTTDYLLGVSDKKSTSPLHEVQMQLSTLDEESLKEAVRYVDYLKWHENH
jgi:transcriptional regulator with XRE-family HTH domain